MTKPPSRKHYEKTKPTYAELEKQLINANHNLTNAQQYERELKNALNSMRTTTDYFDVLKRSEVIVLTPEGMKYLVGQDLEDYCEAEIKKQGVESMWWGNGIANAFSGYANHALNQILRDEIDKADVLDSKQYLTFKTKGRYDSGSKSKEEGS